MLKILLVLFLAPLSAMAEDAIDAAAKLEAAHDKYISSIESAKTTLAGKVKPENAQTHADKDSENAVKAKKTAEEKLADIKKGVEVNTNEDVAGREGTGEGTNDGENNGGDTDSKDPPKLSEEDSQKKIDELEKNAQAMRDKENSTANKLLGAAAIGAAGYGASQMLQGKAEQSADEAAERDMAAYLATFKCDYGQGQNVKGGEKGITLPAENLISLRTEYTTLAAALKGTKESLGLAPGIESETIIDKASSGLYDNAALGKTSGSFTSLSAALSGDEAAKAAWDAQKAESASTAKTGMITAGAGLAIGAVGNLVLNTAGKDGKNILGQLVAKERSAEINKKYSELIAASEKLKAGVDGKPDILQTCPADSTGTPPYCQCKDSAARYFKDKGCQPCEGGKTYDDNNECKCPAEKPVDLNGICTKQEPECKLSGLLKTDKCECIENAEETSSKTNSYLNLASNTTDECKCKEGYYYVSPDNSCRPKQETPVSDAKLADLSTDKLFAPGKYQLDASAINVLDANVQQFVDKAQKASTESPFCIIITGHTDRTQFTKSSTMTNQILSENRAKAIKDYLDGKIGNALITKAIGVADGECTSPPYKANADECRKVNLSIKEGACPI
ncbi:MAG: OmpA family protein [Rickettsiales bacterium]|nr:OmpA family protein [Rickettsiales bacterium]